MPTFRPKLTLSGGRQEPPDNDTLERFLRHALDNLEITSAEQASTDTPSGDVPPSNLAQGDQR